jgi:LPS-assembly protein
MRSLLILIWTLVLLALPAAAQDRATLIADSVTVQSGSVLVADGNVEVYFRGQRLTATAIRYDRTADRLIITGPIRIDDGMGSVFTAQQADLSADMTEGLLTSARLVLNRQLQMTAAALLRSDGGNLTALRNVVASSCTICKGNPTPLWEIRAREVVHDAAAHRILFRNASLRFYGVPVMYLPVLRLPDPTQKRATGFLVPKLRSTSALGTGIKLPYFIAIGESRDLLFTPYLTTRGDNTVELRYRQAFANGDLIVEGAVTRDHLSPDPRGYFQAKGNFDLGRDYKLAFTAVNVSDPAYLLDYGITNEDRLFNQLGLTRVKRNLSFSAELIGFRSIREGDSNSTLPSTVTDIGYERRFSPRFLGGVATVRLDTHGDRVTEGRDVGRVSLSFDWRRNWTTSGGIAVSALSTGAVDSYSISQDPEFDGTPRRFSGAVGVELRWPLVKASGAGVTQLIEPVVQAVLSSSPSTDIPNGDSTLTEFDEGNLFVLDRFPGADAVEGGARLNLGVNYQRTVPDGWSLGATVGRVVRLEDLDQFSNASGLGGKQSDWLAVWSLSRPDGFSLTNRLVLDDTLSLTKAELRFDMKTAALDLSGGYEYLLKDDGLTPGEDRADTASEIVLNAGRKLTRYWRANLSTRYDLRENRLANAGLELDFRNDCIDLTLSLSRRYTTSSNVAPSTDFGLSVELLGFGGGSQPGPSRVCRR